MGVILVSTRYDQFGGLTEFVGERVCDVFESCTGDYLLGWLFTSNRSLYIGAGT
jgi:hypothetical protein